MQEQNLNAKPLTHYQEGYESGIHGLPNTKNPYEKDTKPFDDWLDGWVDGRTALDRETRGEPPLKINEYYN